MELLVPNVSEKLETFISFFVVSWAINNIDTSTAYIVAYSDSENTKICISFDPDFFTMVVPSLTILHCISSGVVLSGSLIIVDQDSQFFLYASLSWNEQLPKIHRTFLECNTFIFCHLSLNFTIKNRFKKMKTINYFSRYNILFIGN